LLSEEKEASDFNLVQVNSEEPESSSPSGSLALLLFEPLSIAGGIGAELPFLQELLDPGLETRWETWVELNPETARALGVRDRDLVRVSSPDGSIEAKARVTSRIVPDAAAIPIGLGRRAGGGRWARGIGVNPLELLSPRRENRRGLPETDTTRVQVTVVAKARPSRPPERKV
jgi:molybdopterin-containing oxidoreductase family iron-sulfur binding subunit